MSPQDRSSVDLFGAALGGSTPFPSAAGPVARESVDAFRSAAAPVIALLTPMSATETDSKQWRWIVALGNCELEWAEERAWEREQAKPTEGWQHWTRLVA